MLRIFRARVCCLVTSLVLAIGTTTASLDQFVHAGDSHDGGYASVVTKHDAARHQVRAAQPSNDDASEHCVACHLARAPRSGAQATAIALRGGETLATAPVYSVGFPSSAALSRVPGRSPPRLA